MVPEGDIEDNHEEGAFDSSVMAAGWMKAGVDKGKAREMSPFNVGSDEFSQELERLRHSLASFQRRPESSPGTTSSSLSRKSSSQIDQISVKDASTLDSSVAQSDGKKGALSASTSTWTTPLLSPLSSMNSFPSTPVTTPGENDPAQHTPYRQQSASSSSQFASISPILLAQRDSIKPEVSRDASKYDIQFRTVNINDVDVSRETILEAVVKTYPRLCEAPARMFAPDGKPLPPTRKQEVSDDERQARRDALVVSYRGRMPHSLVQTTVLLQSRAIIWHRVGDLTAVQQRPVVQVLDSSKLDPWGIHLVHSEVDIHEMADANIKKTFEITKSKRVGKCDRCQGSKQEECRTCRGAEPDECWWCKGSGKASGTKCKQCSGKSVMECKPCQGTKLASCGLCRGEGLGMYAAFLQVSMTRVDFDVVPLSTITDSADDISNPIKIQELCIAKAKETISAFVTTTSSQETTKNSKSPRQHRVHQASASLNHSTSHLLEFRVPQEAKVVLSKKVPPTLRPSNMFHRKLQFSPFYCILPSDPVLQPVELSEAEFSSYLTLSQGIKTDP